jgi:hypothetical protein
MKKYLVVLVAALALLLPATAAAKGPSEARVTGPGLAAPLTVTGIGEGDSSTNLGLLVTEGGFFPEAFGQSPSPLLRAQPKDLSVRYLVTYTVPGTVPSTLQQDLYPFSSGGPVTYMRPGQVFWGNQHTVGGWYRGTAQLKTMLVDAGVPQSTPGHRYVVSMVQAIIRHFLP